MTIIIYSDTKSNLNLVESYTSDFFPVDGATSFSMQSVVTNNTQSAKSFVSGTADVVTVFFTDKFSTGDGDHVIVFDKSGLSYAVYADTTGGNLNQPTSFPWLMVSPSRKTRCDISGVITPSDVATAFATAFNSITGFSTAITAVAPLTGWVIFTQTQVGTTTLGSTSNVDGFGFTQINIQSTTPGTNGDVDIVANTISEPTHSYVTGLKGRLTTNGTLPGGLTTSTDYFVIATSTNLYKFATSLANAKTGTAIDITNGGSSGATHTFTPTVLDLNIKLQYTINDPSLINSAWIDVNAGTNITSTSTVAFPVSKPAYKYMRYILTLNAGYFSSVNYIRAISNKM